MILYSGVNLTIIKNPHEDFARCTWIGIQTQTAIRDGGEKILHAVKDQNIKKILNDNIKVSNPWHHATEWTMNVWFPELFNSGLICFAWILPHKIFPEMSVMRALPINSSVKTFRLEHEAINWLDQSK